MISYVLDLFMGGCLLNQVILVMCSLFFRGFSSLEPMNLAGFMRALALIDCPIGTSTRAGALQFVYMTWLLSLGK